MRPSEKKKPEYRCIRQDITSNCNLRCRFCIHDWKIPHRNVNMDVPTFSKIIDLLPLVTDEGFYFSCRFEPLIHPHLLELLDIIPAPLKNKVFFTTNLSVRLSDDFFQKIANSPIHHINISIETFNPETYKSLCPGGNFEVFYQNIMRIVAVFKKSSNPPKIRFITMILKENFHELIDLAIKSHEEFFADHHEFRTPYCYSLNAIDVAWSENQLLSRTELNEFAVKLKALPFRSCWSMESDDQVLPAIRNHTGGNDNADDYDIYAVRNTPVPADELYKMSMNENLYDLRIESDGTVYFYGTGEKYSINAIPDAQDFFTKKLDQLSEIEALGYQRISDSDYADCIPHAGKIFIDNFFDRGSVLMIRGWTYLDEKDCNEFSKILRLDNGKIHLFYSMETSPRPDVAAHFKNADYLYSGFRCVIKKSDLEGNSFTMKIIFPPKSRISPVPPFYFVEFAEPLVFSPSPYQD